MFPPCKPLLWGFASLGLGLGLGSYVLNYRFPFSSVPALSSSFPPSPLLPSPLSFTSLLPNCCPAHERTWMPATDHRIALVHNARCPLTVPVTGAQVFLGNLHLAMGNQSGRCPERQMGHNTPKTRLTGHLAGKTRIQRPVVRLGQSQGGNHDLAIRSLGLSSSSDWAQPRVKRCAPSSILVGGTPEYSRPGRGRHSRKGAPNGSKMGQKGTFLNVTPDHLGCLQMSF